MKKQYLIHKIETLYKGFFSYLSLSLEHSIYQRNHSSEQMHSAVLQREVMHRKDAIAVILYNLDAQEILLVEQIRAGAIVSQELNQSHAEQSNAWLLEPVAGCIEPGHTPEQTVEREALEEAGVEIFDMEFLYEYYPSPAACDERIFLYAAQYDAQHSQDFGGLTTENEDIKVVKLSFSNAQQRLLRGQFNVSTTLLGLQWLFWHKLPASSIPISET